MKKSLSCKDAGADCTYVARGDTEEEVIRLAGEHGKKVHGFTDKDLTPDFIEKMKSIIRDL